jgi:hypothetical protein
VALAVSVSMAAWQAAVTGELAEELAVEGAVAVGVVEVAAFVTLAVAEEDVALEVTPAELTVAPALTVTVAVSVTVWVTVAVTV